MLNSLNAEACGAWSYETFSCGTQAYTVRVRISTVDNNKYYVVRGTMSSGLIMTGCIFVGEPKQRFLWVPEQDVSGCSAPKTFE